MGLPLFNGVSATTSVGNTIDGSTTWTVAGSPYALTEDLYIYSGETLTIQPGVVVNLRGYKIQIYGELRAQGTNNNRIHFSGDGFSNSQIIFKPASAQSCAIDYGVFYSVPITIEGGSPRLANGYFTGTASNSAVITVNSGTVSIIDNVISTQNTQDGIQINAGYVTITGNTLSGARAQQGCGIFNTGSTAPITLNKITNFYTGIYTNTPCMIERNTITNNVNDGIVVEGTTDVTIRHNAITYNKCGISGDANIQNNTISHNTYGLWSQTSRSTIQYNNIVDSSVEGIHLTEASDVLATNNWWGTTVESNIRQRISDYDQNLRSNLGVVTFTPFLTTPAYAPALPPAVVVPTPPPAPFATVSPSPGSNLSPSPDSMDAYPTYAPYSPYPSPTSGDPTIIRPVQPTGEPGIGGFGITDIITAVVIVVAVSVAITIILIINRIHSNTQQTHWP